MRLPILMASLIFCWYGLGVRPGPGFKEKGPGVSARTKLNFLDITASGKTSQAVEDHTALELKFLPEGGIRNRDDESVVALHPDWAAAGGIVRPHYVLPISHDHLDGPLLADLVLLHDDLEQCVDGISGADGRPIPVLGQTSQVGHKILNVSWKSHVPRFSVPEVV